MSWLFSQHFFNLICRSMTSICRNKTYLFPSLHRIPPSPCFSMISCRFPTAHARHGTSVTVAVTCAPPTWVSWSRRPSTWCWAWSSVMYLLAPLHPWPPWWVPAASSRVPHRLVTGRTSLQASIPQPPPPLLPFPPPHPILRLQPPTWATAAAPTTQPTLNTDPNPTVWGWAVGWRRRTIRLAMQERPQDLNSLISPAAPTMLTELCWVLSHSKLTNTWKAPGHLGTSQEPMVSRSILIR